MRYEEAMEFLALSYKFGSKLGLSRISTLLNYLGNPHKELKFVHLAGTNGKGSTTNFLSNILIEAGYKTGTFISPYIERFSERIKIGHDEITKQDIGRIMEIIKEKVELMEARGEGIPTEFELVTAMGMLYYYEQKCDIVVLEVGLGGKLDSTNVIDSPLAAVITAIDYDHMDILGSTLKEIASEKAGIIKESCHVVMYPASDEVLQVFKKKCMETGSGLTLLNYNDVVLNHSNLEGQSFNYKAYKNLQISLLSDFQIMNGAVAVSTAEVLMSKGYNITESHIKAGLLNAKWPGRFEIVHKAPFFVVDGAHNIQGVTALVRNLKKFFEGKKVTFIIGVMADKDYKTMMKIVAPIARRFITVRPKNPRAMDAAALAEGLKEYGVETIAAHEAVKGIDLALELCSDSDVVCSFGSFYYVSEVRQYFGL